jgi:subtilase family serine protease
MHRAAIAAALSAGIALFAAAAAADASTSGIVTETPRFVRHAAYLGPVAPNTPIRIVVHLAYPNPSAVDSFARIVRDPSSPMFEHYLTEAQFTAAFAPSGAAYAGVARTAQAAGLRVVGTYGDRKVIDMTGDAAHVGALLHTQFGRFAVGSRQFYANTSPVRPPAAWRGAVMAVSGLNNFDRLRSHLIAVKRNGSQPMTGGLPPYSPFDIETAYDEPIHVNPAINGSTSTGGHATIAIETAFDYLDSDLQGFWSQWGVTRSPGAYVYRVFVDNPTNQGIFDPNDSVETTADTEQTTANATGANVQIVEGVNNLTTTFDDVYAHVVNDPRVDVVTTSWGLCEIDEDPNEVLADSDLFKQGTAVGQTMFAASGDNGSKDCTDNTNQNTVTGVDFPASSPWVGASGGTTLTLNSNSTIKSETAWSGSGGGVSVMFALPSYQTAVPTLASTSGRNVPDVALNADVNTGYALYYLGQGTLLQVGGTSLVAPNMAAMYAQFDGYYNKRLGLAANGLYVLFPVGKYPGKLFHDILTGSNGDFSAHAGYDNVTGVGSVDGYKYMLAIPHRKGQPL